MYTSGVIKAAIGGSISVVALSLLIGGCRHEPLPVGKFRGEHAIVGRPGADPVIVNQLRRVDLTIADDGKAVLEDGGLPREGQMSRDGEKLKFEVLTVYGRNVELQPPDQPRSFYFQLKKDGTILYGDAILRPQP